MHRVYSQLSIVVAGLGSPLAFAPCAACGGASGGGSDVRVVAVRLPASPSVAPAESEDAASEVPIGQPAACVRDDASREIEVHLAPPSSQDASAHLEAGDDLAGDFDQLDHVEVVSRDEDLDWVFVHLAATGAYPPATPVRIRAGGDVLDARVTRIANVARAAGFRDPVRCPPLSR